MTTASASGTVATGVVWDTLEDTLEVAASALSTIRYQLTGQDSSKLQISAFDGLVWSNPALAAMQSNSTGALASNIFRAEGGGLQDVGLLRVLADFSKAAYALQPWENRNFNDYSPNADAALVRVTQQGWTPLDLTLVGLQAKSVAGNDPNNVSLAATNAARDGFFTNGQAAAFVARTGDSIVLSFRGTNDNTEGFRWNSNVRDQDNSLHPDVFDWVLMQDVHYALFDPLLQAIDRFVADSNSGIRHVYVTGHSLGGAMAQEFMDMHADTAQVNYQSITFAAPPFSSFVDDPRPDSRILHIEIHGDPVPYTDQSVIYQQMPGRTIVFWGNQTEEKLDWRWGTATYGNDDNHSMDYYWQVVRSLDAEDLSLMLRQNVDLSVLIPARSGPYFNTPPSRESSQFDSYFVVDGRVGGYAQDLVVPGLSQFTTAQSGMSSPIYAGLDLFYPGGQLSDNLTASRLANNAIYGGQGDDIITGGLLGELLMGGFGKDMLFGNDGDDVIFGGPSDDLLGGGESSSHNDIDTALFSGSRSSYQITRVSSSVIAVTDKSASGAGGRDTLTQIERVKFDSGLSVAFDLDARAGQVAKLIGAIFGASNVRVPAFVGVGIDILDKMGDFSIANYTALADLALKYTLGNDYGMRDAVNLLYTNLVGSSPSTAESLALTAYAYANLGTPAKLAVFAAEMPVNAANINLAGLIDSGMEYQPVG